METKKVETKKGGFKDTVRRVWKKFLIFVKKKYNQFMKLPKHIRIITYIWLIVLLLLLIIICGSAINNKFQKKYKDMEDRIATVALRYAKEEEIYGSKENDEKIDIEFLFDNSYISRDEFDDKTCHGFVVLSYDEDDDAIEAKTYLNCKKYTTKGYKNHIEDKKDKKK